METIRAGNRELWHYLVERGMILSCVPFEYVYETYLSDVVFCLGNTYYSIPSSLIKEILPLGSYIPLPFIHPGIVGLIWKHEHPLPIIDMHYLTNMEPVTPSPDEALIILQLAGMEIGLLTDSIYKFAQEPLILNTTKRQPARKIMNC
jgi:hypothetical protein